MKRILSALFTIFILPAKSQIPSNLIGDITKAFPSKSLTAITINKINDRIPHINVKDYGAKGDGTTDDTNSFTSAIAAASASDIIIVPKGIYIVTTILLNKNGITLTGKGTIKKKANNTNFGLNVTASECTVSDLSFDGTNAQTVLNYTNSLIFISGSKNNFKNLRIKGSKGDGIFVASDNNAVKNCIVNHSRENGIIVYGSGNTITGNHIDSTMNQNGIFITASPGSIYVATYVYDNIISDNTIFRAGDTGIETGIHTIRTLINGNIVYVKNNPGILLRDCRYIVANYNIINMLPSCSSDGIAVVPQTEPSSWNYESIISNNVICGQTNRSGIYIGGCNITITYNEIKNDITVVNNTTGVGLLGAGIMITDAVGLTKISVTNNTIEKVNKGIDFNYPVLYLTYSEIEVLNNNISSVHEGINLYRCTFKKSKFALNTIRKVKTKGINNTESAGSNTTFITDNLIDLAGFSSATPVPIAQFAQAGFLFDYKIKIYDLPLKQYTSIVIIDSDKIIPARLLLQFDDYAEFAIIDIYPETGTGNNKSYKVVKSSSGIVDNSSDFSGWGITKDGSGQIILQRRGIDYATPKKVVVSQSSKYGN